MNYVRDRAAADVHVLVTTQGTGGGGTQYALKFIGLGPFKGVDNSLTYSVPRTATPDERRRGLASLLKLGLVRYVTATSLASQLTLRFNQAAGQPLGDAASDPWNFWVYRLSGNGSFNGEQSSKSSSYRFSASATRITEARKISASFDDTESLTIAAPNAPA